MSNTSTNIFSFKGTTRIGSVSGRIEAPTAQVATTCLMQKYPQLVQANISLLKNQDQARKKPFIPFSHN